MRLAVRIAARHSDLARLQAQVVGAALARAHPDLQISYSFRASLGDANQEDPLWRMPTKGVFTEDFVSDLIEDRADLVVHSWKDLPTAPREFTEVAATLPRADGRDLLLLRRDRLDAMRESGSASLLTSSPRRAHNLGNFLRTALPFPLARVSFVDVRGNVPTRLRKMLAADADGLIVAKAALDRLLESDALAGQCGAEYESVRLELRAALAQCRWMVLPLSINPGAAAQGALAIEIRRDRADLRERLAAISCASTLRTVERERAILAGYGGGCHQKIGVAVLSRPYGEIVYLKGLTDAGQTLDQARLERASSVPRASSATALFPDARSGEGALFDREALPASDWERSIERAQALWIARETGMPVGHRPRDDQLVWCAGPKSWLKLAARGIWVNGSADGLGESESPQIEALYGRPCSWSRLSHADSGNSLNLIATYRLRPRTKGSGTDFRDKTHFFWMSGSAFDEALRLDPSLVTRGHHACGPGKTAGHVARALGVDPTGQAGRFSVCLGIDAWRAEALG